MKREGHPPLTPAYLRTDFLPPAEFWRIFITEDVLKRVADSLPSGGLSKVEREKQISKIDAEISSLEGQLEKMAKEV